MSDRLSKKYSYNAIAIVTAILNLLATSFLLYIMFLAKEEDWLKWGDNSIYTIVAICILLVFIQTVSFVSASRAKEFREKYYGIGISLSFLSLLNLVISIIIAFDIFY